MHLTLRSSWAAWKICSIVSLSRFLYMTSSGIDDHQKHSARSVSFLHPLLINFSNMKLKLLIIEQTFCLHYESVRERMVNLISEGNRLWLKSDSFYGHIFAGECSGCDYHGGYTCVPWFTSSWPHEHEDLCRYRFSIWCASSPHTYLWNLPILQFFLDLHIYRFGLCHKDVQSSAFGAIISWHRNEWPISCGCVFYDYNMVFKSLFSISGHYCHILT